MKRIILFLVILNPLFSYPQMAEDSLLSQLKNINPIEHDSIYYELYLMFRDSAPEKSLQYAYDHYQ